MVNTGINTRMSMGGSINGTAMLLV
jgi:hypothetical protein